MWAPAVFKGEQRVFAEVNADGSFVVVGGKVAMKYKDAESATVYRATASNLVRDGEVIPEAPKPARTVAPSAGIVVWTDGACSGNPGPAGSGALLEMEGRTLERSLGLGVSTNNVGELTAVKLAMELLTEAGVTPDQPVDLYTDSKYAIGVLSQGWKAKANAELIADIKAGLRAWPNVRLRWVEGHAGVPGNERADALARRGVEESRRRG